VLTNRFIAANPYGSSPVSAVEAPVDDLTPAAYQAFRLNYTFAARENAQSDVIHETMLGLYTPLQDRTGDSNMYDKARGSAHRLMNTKDPYTGKVITEMPHANYVALRSDLEKKGITDVPQWEDIELRAKDKAKLSQSEYERAQLFNVSSAPRWDALQGGVMAGAADPPIMAATLLSLPMALSSSPLVAFGMEAAIGLASEVPVQVQVNAWQQELGQEYTVGDMAQAMLWASLLPGTIGGGLSILARTLGHTTPTLFQGPGALGELLTATNAQWDEVAQRLNIPNPSADVLKLDNRLYDAIDYGSIDFKPIDSPWQQRPSMLTATADQIAEFPADSEIRAAAISLYRDMHLDANNPAGGYRSLDQGSSIDSVNYVFNRVEIDNLHRLNTAEAITALQERRMPVIADPTSISTEFFAMVDSRHVYWARELVESDIKVSPRNPKYQNFLFESVMNAVLPSVRRARDMVPGELPAAKITKKAPRPGTPKKTISTRLSTLAGNIDKELAAIRAARAARSKGVKAVRETNISASKLGVSRAKTPTAFKRTPSGAYEFKFSGDTFIARNEGRGAWVLFNDSDPSVPTTRHKSRAAAANAAREYTSKVHKRRLKLEQEKFDAEAKVVKTYVDTTGKSRLKLAEYESRMEELTDAINQHKIADEADFNNARINAAIDAQRQLDELAAGTIPKEMEGLRRRLNTSMKELTSDPEYLQQAAMTGGLTRRTSLSSKVFAQDYALENFTMSQPARDAAIKESISPEAVKQAARVLEDVEGSFVVGREADDGEIVLASVDEILQEHKNWDDVLKAMKECSL